MDIEGTVIPIAFVRDTLIPYAKERLPGFLHQHRRSSIVREHAMRCLDTVAMETGVKPNYEGLTELLIRWIEEDRKHIGLKAIQGLIWEEGYRTGAFTPRLYEDVVSSLHCWHTNRIRLALYSSGSEQAQRLLMGHTNHGDLTGFFSYFFDINVGPKTESASYARISKILDLPPAGILFLSDAESELDAAAAAGLQTTQIVRCGSHAGIRHPVSSDFHCLKDLLAQ